MNRSYLKNGRTMTSDKYYIYILSNKSRMLYVGLTTDLDRMLTKHREMRLSSFKGNFGLKNLVYVEEIENVEDAVSREIELKSLPFCEKKQLLDTFNPYWECIRDLWVKG